MTEKCWVRVDVLCTPGSADDVAAGLASELSTGVEVTEEGARLYFQGTDLGERDGERLRAALRRVEVALSLESPLAHSISVLDDDNWADNWKAYFKPLRVGRRLVICPTWETVTAENGDLLLWMDPGRAFGTGQHETTRLCLEWLEERAEEVREPESLRVLDLGTGSGVLAVGAALLGYGAVLGVDNDPEALDVAAENAHLNKVDGVVRLQVGSVGAVTSWFDRIVANILALPLIHMAADLAALLSPTGRMALSGILVEQKGEVQKAYETAGLDLVDWRSAGEWCLLDFRRGEKTQKG